MQKLKIKNIRTNSQVSYPHYTENETQNISVTDEDQTSPTASDFLVTPPLNPQLSTLTQPFVINYPRLDKHLESQENILRRNLYRMKYPFMTQRKQLFHDWQAFMLETKSEIFFLDFLDQINNPKIVQTLTKARWKTSTSSVLSSHPPVETIIIDHLNSPITASPFKIAIEDLETENQPRN